MLKAIIFDFNGVILNDEPLHFEAMRDAVADLGIRLTREDYWNKYLPFDDTECLENVCRDHSFQLDETTRREALDRKARNYKQLLRGRFPLFSGAAQFVQAAAGRYPLAIASGARRTEIESALDSIGLKRYFTVVVAAEDFVLGKPNPESFLLALEWLNAARDTTPILPEECLVIEDSVGGVRGARAAGMRCVAVTSSYPSEALQAANRVVSTLENIPLDSLNDLFEEIR
jgi:HAD superfamily hydrolase (TIGR01509 family)